VAENPIPAHRLYYESIMTLGNGYVGVRGSPEESRPGRSSLPLVLVAEVYDRPGRRPGEPRKFRRPSRLAPAPNPLPVVFHDGSRPLVPGKAEVLSESLTLDMKRGVLARKVRYRSLAGRITSIVTRRIVSQARPHALGVRVAITPVNYSGPVTLTSRMDGLPTYPDRVFQTQEFARAWDGETLLYAARTRQSRVIIAEAVRHSLTCGDRAVEGLPRRTDGKSGIGLTWRFEARRGHTYVLEKQVALDTSVRAKDPIRSVRALVAESPGYARLEREHAATWAEYWRDADVEIQGDRLARTAVRFCVFHLLQAASRCNAALGLSASVPAKMLSGPGYGGHVFWDTEIYMLPFYSQEFPDVAESLLRYRSDRVEAAARNAADGGCAGLRFPWESAGDGREECPRWLPRGKGYFRWRGGEQEVHITADVAFGFWQHYLATGRREFLRECAAEVIIGAAAFWADRARPGASGRNAVYEIRNVIGPDEYHSSVNNSVYTNAMARWNLVKALELADELQRTCPAAYGRLARRFGLTGRRLAGWRRAADGLKINFDSRTGLYEQFDGYFAHERQDIKQADVLLMLYLLPEMRTAEVYRRNFDRYHPVTTHGSSLSPCIHALAALDVERPDQAYQYARQAFSMDCVRRGNATDSGLHAAALGGGWMAAVAGFGGVRVMPDCLRVLPSLPARWRRLQFSVAYRGLRLRFDVTRGSLVVRADPGQGAVCLELFGKRRTIAAGQRLRVPRE